MVGCVPFAGSVGSLIVNSISAQCGTLSVGGLIGSVMTNSVPLPTVDSNLIEPECASMIFLEMASPSPVPDDLVEKFGTKIFSLFSLGIPEPRS